MKRRTLLKAAPAGLAALAVGGAAEAAGDTLVMALFREWRAVQEAEDAAYSSSDEAAQDRTGDARMEIECRLLEAPAQCARDWVAKATALSAFGVFGLPSDDGQEQFWTEARALIGGAA